MRVYNISSQPGIAGRTADQIKQGGYNVTEVGNLSLPDVSATTVYFGNAPGEHETADARGPAAESARRAADASSRRPAARRHRGGYGLTGMTPI